jgi:hypothetical protein
MMKIVVAALALIASADAFAPSARSASPKSQLAAVSFDNDIAFAGTLSIS